MSGEKRINPSRKAKENVTYTDFGSDRKHRSGKKHKRRQKKDSIKLNNQGVVHEEEETSSLGTAAVADQELEFGAASVAEDNDSQTAIVAEELETGVGTTVVPDKESEESEFVKSQFNQQESNMTGENNNANAGSSGAAGNQKQEALKAFRKNPLKSIQPQEVSMFLDRCAMHFRGGTPPYTELVDDMVSLRIAEWADVQPRELTDKQIEDVLKEIAAHRYGKDEEREDLIAHLKWDDSLPARLAVRDLFAKIHRFYPEDRLKKHSSVKKYQILLKILEMLPKEFGLTEVDLHRDSYGIETDDTGMMTPKEVEELVMKRLDAGYYKAALKLNRRKRVG